MLHGRERVGETVGAAIAQLPATFAKVKRLSLPFGPKLSKSQAAALDREYLHEHYIREIPLSGGALGCALWDGGVVLARWMYDHGSLFHDKEVLELGCGVGLGGIMAAHWARRVVLTDYIEAAVENAAYNVRINSTDDADEVGAGGDDDDDDSAATARSDGGHGALPVVGGAPYRTARLHEIVSSAVLDWDAVARESSSTPPSPDAAGTAAGAHPLCSRAPSVGVANTSSFVQPWIRCRTCWPTDDNYGCCMPCADLCHAGHDLHTPETSKFKCDCGTPSDVVSACRAKSQVDLGTFDVIVGSELTYNLLSCSSLATVVDKYLKPDGVFVEVLSDDRDGVSVFIEEIERRGFVTIRCPAPEKYVGNFGTRKWSKQAEETYSIYFWRRGTAPLGDLLREIFSRNGCEEQPRRKQ